MLAIVVVFYFHRPGDMDPAGKIEYFRWSHSAIGSFPCVRAFGQAVCVF